MSTRQQSCTRHDALGRLLGRKDDAHYGLGSLAAGEERRMVEWAHRLLANATTTLER